jgi:hypothetical protein
MRKLESMFYEIRPYFLLLLGLYVLIAQKPSAFGIACVLILLVCSGTIIRFRLQARRGTAFEQIFYDLQPVFYLGLALYALVWLHHSKFALACALLLLFCGSVILRWRMQKPK